nr:uncharacterized protein LOC129452950 [Misgurnus anguillicaudatus]
MEMKNISFPDEGLYKCIVFYTPTDKEEFTLHLKVTAPLPVPVITRDSSSSSKCVFLCSVLNVRDVSLSWYKGNSLLSSISVSDLNIRLSLPLEVEYQDTNTYRCVLNNPITNQTQHLNITQLCQTCSNVMTLTVLIISVVLLVFMSVAVIHCYCRKSLQTIQEGKNYLQITININFVIHEKCLSEYTEIIYRLQIRDDFSSHLPVPVITRDSSSSSNCSLLCSVLNVDYQDTNTYSCVVNNTITNQTQHLNITHLCQPCSDCVSSCDKTEAVIRLVVSALVGVAAVSVLLF